MLQPQYQMLTCEPENVEEIYFYSSSSGGKKEKHT